MFNALAFDACVAQMLLDYCWKNSIILKVELQFFPHFSFSSNVFFLGLNLHSKLTDLMFRKKQLRAFFLNALCWRLVHFETRRSTHTKRILAKQTLGLATFLLAEKNP